MTATATPDVTATATPDVTATASPTVVQPLSAREAAASSEPAKGQAPPLVRLISTAITILSVALLSFGTYVCLLSRLHHDRAQLVAYANFRKELALGTAPTGQTKPGDATKLLDPGAPVAVLRIPKLGLREVVFEGTNGSVLQKGPGHLRQTPLPGQAGTSVIMGRAITYGGPFGPLSRLRPGDTFTVMTGQGVHRYTVLDVRHGGMPQPPRPASGAGRLTLTTAYGELLVPSDVLRVDADLTSAVQPSPRRPLGTSQISHAEQVMGVDTTAWVPLVLIGQALLLTVCVISVAGAVWGRRQVWLLAVPAVTFFGLATADQAARLLPNLL